MSLIDLLLWVYETYCPGPVLRANYQSQSNNKNYFPRKMKYACNCLKHQNNQKKDFHNFEVEFGQRDGKMYYEIQKALYK